MEFVRVATLAEVPEGELRAFDLPIGRIAVAHDGERVYAVADECPHGGCSLAEGTLSDAEAAVACATDGSAFDLTSGEPITGPARDPVEVHAARVRDGWIEIALVAGDRR